ncbi:YodL domain-containing protein [Oribacterium sp. HCP3S3_B9]|uniref:YodL domain-containing protein n=1 Tax=Oribacterium sp. HCP3S3_B9 TaxID=3438946 RepID=UPI003F8B4ED5
MAVFRVERNKGYTVMSNHHLRNKELSLKAKGLLSQMLSLPEDWDYTLAGLSFINREKIDAIREAVKELERAGYIVRSRERDEKGRLRGADYVIFEQPQTPPVSDLPTLENPTLDNPTLEKPTQKKPTLENPTQLNKDIQKRGDETRDFRFEPYDRLQAAGLSVEAANYDLIYTAPLTPDMTLESIWEKFNIDHPKDFKGHSLSVSDVVVLHQNGQDTAHYVDSFGYKNVPEFLQEQKQLTPDELETGETIKTPRGTFYVTDMSHEQMEAAGYGFHHQSDDGKYFIMGNGTRAFAIAAEPPENYLKTAEQTTEQNYNMIDGQINNTPTVDELEAKVKAGETISLVDLANAVKADKERGKAKPEKKPSIRAQLLADKEKAQKKPAKQKSQDLERS